MLRIRILVLVSPTRLWRHGMLIVGSELLSPVIHCKHCVRREAIVAHCQEVRMLRRTLGCQVVRGRAQSLTGVFSLSHY